MKRARSELAQLTIEVRKLRQAIERTQRALLNGRDAAFYVGYSHPTFYKLVSRGVIPQTRLDDDSEPRYSRMKLDQIIAEKTQPMGEMQ